MGTLYYNVDKSKKDEIKNFNKIQQAQEQIESQGKYKILEL